MSIEAHPHIQAVALTVDVINSIKTHIRGNALDCKNEVLSDKNLNKLIEDFVVDISTEIDNIVKREYI